MSAIYVVERNEGEYEHITWSMVAWYWDEIAAQRHVVMATERHRKDGFDAPEFTYHKVPAGDAVKVAAEFAAQQEAGLISPELADAVDGGMVAAILAEGRSWKGNRENWRKSNKEAAAAVAAVVGCSPGAAEAVLGRYELALWASEVGDGG